MESKLSISELLSYTTVRIECTNKDNQKSTGTGFFFKFKEQGNGNFIPVIITNKHVVKDAIEGKFYLTPMSEDGKPIDNNPKPIIFKDPFDAFENRWHFHPDPDVDLCVMGMTDVAYLYRKRVNSNFFAVYFDKSILPKASDLEDVSAIEDVYMVGYPNGIWDNANNKPIFRKGITATNIKFDYQGKKEFLIDMACFPGSSGSPVFIFNEGGYRDKHGNTYLGRNRVILLGTLYAGPQHTAQGDVEIIDIPTSQRAVAISRIPNNLGLVIKSERILELEDLFNN